MQFFIKRTLVVFVFVFMFVLSTKTAFAAVPAITTTVMQNTTATTVDFYLTGTSFSSFSHGYSGSAILNADSTDLNNITYNLNLHPSPSLEKLNSNLGSIDFWPRCQSNFRACRGSR